MTENEAIEVIKRLVGISPSERIVRVVNIATEALEEIQQYRAIGTVDECRLAKERLIPRKAVIGKVFKTMGYYQCPICGGLLMRDEKFCNDCGQRIGWQ